MSCALRTGRSLVTSSDLLTGLFGLVDLVALAAALLSSVSHAREAAAQDWPPFVFVAGLLLVGLVADGDGLFAAAGH